MLKCNTLWLKVTELLDSEIIFGECMHDFDLWSKNFLIFICPQQINDPDPVIWMVSQASFQW